MSLPAERVCCDPLKCHKKPNRKGLRTVPHAIIAAHPSLHLTRRHFICTMCRKEMKLQLAVSTSPDDTADTFPADLGNSELESGATANISPASDISDVENSGQEDASSDSSQSLSLSEQFKAKRSRCESEAVQSGTSAVSMNDGEEMIQQLVEKFHSTTVRSERLTVLTAVPKSWSVRKTAKVFNASRYLAGQAKRLVAEKGVLSSPNSSYDHGVNVAFEEVKKFYLSDDISRVMPGMKNFVSVRGADGKRVHQPKRLLMCNLREAYREFKERNPGLKVGFSKFAQLRPAECVLAGASGTHSVCVCKIHQNVKLMMVGSRLEHITGGEIKHYRHCLAKMQCFPPSLECFLGKCTVCPGVEILCAELQAIMDECEIDSVEYRQWTNTDRSSLETKVQTVDEFLDSFGCMLEKLLVHDLIAKMQADFMREKKESLGPGEFLVVADFSENFSFVVQDEIQSFHWSNNSATIHPFVCYYRDNGELRSVCYIVISSCIQHDVNAVHLFQRKLINFLTQVCCGGQLPKKIWYMSDGCAAQYKNCKNFLNLCHHFADFGVYAEWHFFATSHGKSAGDGAGGTVKRVATKACLQHPYDNHILTALQLYEFAVGHIQGMHFGFATVQEHDEEAKMLEERHKMSRTVPGTQSLHSFIPLSACMVEVRQFSKSAICRAERVVHREGINCAPCTAIGIGGYVTVVYNEACWLGCVLSVVESECVVTVKFLHPQLPSSSFVFPDHEDIMDIDPSDILTHVNPITTTGRTYTLSKTEMQEANCALAARQ